MQADPTRVADERGQFSAPPANVLSAKVLPARQQSRATRRPVPARGSQRMARTTLSPVAGLWRGVRRAFDSDIERGSTFLFAPVFMAAGALVYFTLRREPAFTPLLLCFGLAVALLSFASARPAVRAGLLAVAMFFAGALAGKIETRLAATPMLGSEITTRLTGRVMRIEHQATGRVRLTLDVLATERPTLRHAPQRVRATVRSIAASLAPGDVVRGVVRLMPPAGPVRPQSYDFAFTSYFSGIGASGFFMSGVDIVGSEVLSGLQTRIAATVEGWRGRMAGHIERSIGGPEGAVAAALITGVRAGIPEEINEALRITGLYHVISISGLHMALVAGTLMVSLRAGFALFPTFAMRRPVKKYAAFCALLATGLYLIMSGGDVAAQRSFIMLAVMLLAVVFDRAALTMRNLAISALVILVVAPHEVVGPSFQMSFAATAALVAAYGAWRNRRSGRLKLVPAAKTRPLRMLRGLSGYAIGLSVTSVVAGLATALFTAWHFQQVSPLSLIANLVAMPVVSVVVMPMAVLASLLMPFGLDGPALWMMGQGIAVMNTIAIRLAGHSTFDATGAIPLAAVLTLTTALALLVMSESALRWAALPFLIIGVGLLVTREMPAAFVSDDATLVALRLGDGRIAVNRSRPRSFTMDNWRRAFGGDEIVRPTIRDLRRRDSRADGGDIVANGFALLENGGASPETGFICSGDLCVASGADGAMVVHAANAAAARSACGIASLIVIADATADSPCINEKTAIITARQLARQGSAEIFFHRRHGLRGEDRLSATLPDVEIRHAITEPFRPWHAHRRHSRAARGLAPYQSRRRQQIQLTPSPATQAAAAQTITRQEESAPSAGGSWWLAHRRASPQ